MFFGVVPLTASAKRLSSDALGQHWLVKLIASRRIKQYYLVLGAVPRRNYLHQWQWRPSIRMVVNHVRSNTQGSYLQTTVGTSDDRRGEKTSDRDLEFLG